MRESSRTTIVMSLVGGLVVLALLLIIARVLNILPVSQSNPTQVASITSEMTPPGVGTLFPIPSTEQSNPTSAPTTDPAAVSTSEPLPVTPLATVDIVQTETPTPKIATTATSMPSPDLIKIAVISPITGVWEAVGTGIRNAAGLAIVQQNRPLASLGYRLEYLPLNDEGKSDVGRKAAQLAVNDPDVLCVVGHFNSGVTLAAYEAAYKDAGIVVISPSNTNPAVTDSTENVWRVVGRDDVQGLIGSQFAREQLNIKKVYIIHDNTAYGRGIADVFRRDILYHNLEVLNFQSYDNNPETVDFSPLIEDIKSRQPDLIYFTGAATRAGVFFRIAREQGITSTFMGPDGLDQKELLDLGGDAVVGMYFTTVAAPASKFPQAETFVKDYQNKYDLKDAPAFSLESYDATTICIQAIAKAAIAAGNEKPTRAQVVEAMKTLPPFQGISGNYRFNNNGDPESVGYYVVRVTDRDWANNTIEKSLSARSP